MEGIIFNLVDEAVTTGHGEAAWTSVLATAGVDGAHTSRGKHASTDVAALLDAGAEELGVAPEVRKVRAGATSPDLWSGEDDPDGPMARFRLQRQLCAPGAMMTDASTYVGEQARLTGTECLLGGADHRVFAAQFVAA